MLNHKMALESLERRRFLSAAFSVDASILDTAPPGGEFTYFSATPSIVNSALTASGTFTKKTPIPDAGTHYHFTGAGGPGPYGDNNQAYAVRAKITTPGFTPFGHATGTITFSSPVPSSGVLVFTVKGPREPGFGPLPGTLKYIESGNGATGTILVSRSAGHHFTFTFQPA